MSTVISVDNLSKSYRLGQIGTGTFAHDLNVWWARLRGKPNPMLRIGETDHGNRNGEELWALRDVSFTVEQGEILGIIGHNGAGKSTLLKILSRITSPTSGNIKVKGRLASLLEVGTGFHPELTGRENIYLNGAILGMKRAEINHKFDEIVDFSGVEKFIDTPVKRYSSGMYVRLAFAVAAHLEPEILLVDEVLAVGDASFQKKCLTKMGDIGREGRTILFVSHNMAAVRMLCNQVILLENGQIAIEGEAHSLVDRYLQLSSDVVGSAEKNWPDLETAPGNDTIKLRSIRVCDDQGKTTSVLDIRKTFSIEIEYINLKAGAELTIAALVSNQDGIDVFSSASNHEPKWHGKPRPKGTFRSTCLVPGNLLADGHYSVMLLVAEGDLSNIIFREREAITFTLSETGGTKGSYLGKWDGIIRPLLKWSTVYLDFEDKPRN